MLLRTKYGLQQLLLFAAYKIINTLVSACKSLPFDVGNVWIQEQSGKHVTMYSEAEVTGE